MNVTILWLVFEGSFREVICQPLVAEIVTATVVFGAVVLVAGVISGDGP
jgi:hypothetical protein